MIVLISLIGTFIAGFITGIMVGRNNKKRIEKYMAVIEQLGDSAPESLKKI